MKVYVNLSFLENLFLAEEQTERHFYIKKLLSSSQSSVEVIVDVDIEKAYKEADRDIEKSATRTFLRQIAQKFPVSDLTFLTACQTKEFHESGEPKLFFVDGISLTINQEFGCFYVSTTCLEEADFLFYAEEIRIDKNQRDWSILKNIKHPCNALVVTDNYLFSDQDSYLENIKSICENLMPATLAKGFKFDVTLIGYDSKNEFRSIQTQYKALGSYFKDKFPYPVNLSIIRDTYHDRYIFTNYYRIASGNGFALFKNKQLIRGKETTIHCKSLAHEGRLSSTHQASNDEMQKCVAINRTDRMPDKIAGDRKNRLLE